MQVRFLLGPAGSGKTFRCLACIRDALRSEPDGPPLILLAPKQATFQIERQLLGAGDITGFSRLGIYSFDKLARFVFEKLNLAPPRLLSAEGRVMVLRALLLQHEEELKLFGRSARRPGFATELSALLSELQQHQLSPTRLRTLADKKGIRAELQNKLLDLALLHESYSAWLNRHGLQDADQLLDVATEALRGLPKKDRSRFHIAHLWLDGFAEMTPQELDLLGVVIPFCDEATLAFCLENEAVVGATRLSIWSAISKTFQQCRDRLSDVEIKVEDLKRNAAKSRFAGNPALILLEQHWASPETCAVEISPAIRVAACTSPDHEAVLAAREILKFVRAGNRFRDCAVLVRTLDAHHRPLARVFRRYGIPFFLDRREAVTHHPLAEVTRSALRTVAFDWEHDDWFAALKAGFSPVLETEIDRLENAALEFGWRGQKWREVLGDDNFGRLLTAIIPPYEEFHDQLAKTGFQPNGAQLAEAIRELWQRLDVETTLAEWSSATEAALQTQQSPSLHATVYEQMNLWLENLALAFPTETMPLKSWLPVLEAGLSGLTVGVIPPALDQVLVGAIDRARNPDLKFSLLLGVNESVFPASPAAPTILTSTDRSDLEEQNVNLGPSLIDQIAREHYLGYIACTRATSRLLISHSRQGDEGQALNPSPFITQLQRIFPALKIEAFESNLDWQAAEHADELAPLLIQPKDLAISVRNQLLAFPPLRSLADKLAQLREPDGREMLSPVLAERVYGRTLRSSVSRLEEFAQCPFKFFVRSGLHAGERKLFELDARERGNFQHDVLKAFHEELLNEGRRWRDLTPAEARERIGDIAAAQMPHFRHGLLRDSARSAFSAQTMAGSLQDFVEVIVTWMREQNDFDPAQVELGFGGKSDAAPAWEIALDDRHRLALQGRIDRVDLWRDPDGQTALAVVTDYKSSGKKLDLLLVEHGIQLQLLAYLGALRHWKDPHAAFGVDRLVPAGAFYVNLRGEFEGGDTRDEILDDAAAKRLAYRHNGRFDAAALRKLDHRTEVDKGDQFNYKLNKDGRTSKTSEAMDCKDFTRLLDLLEERIRGLGRRIFAGSAEVDPYRKGKQKPCEYCDYKAACRIDDWTHEFRVLKAATEKEETKTNDI